MSTLVTTNISNGSETLGTTYLVNGVGKTWIVINGTGTVAVRDSFNVSSTTDNAVGKYQATLTNNMNNASYLSSSVACYNTVDANQYDIYISPRYAGGSTDNARTTSVCRYGAYDAAYIDVLNVGVFILGDLA
jgi:hypothetical protein